MMTYFTPFIDDNQLLLLKTNNNQKLFFFNFYIDSIDNKFVVLLEQKGGVGIEIDKHYLSIRLQIYCQRRNSR